MTSQDSKTILIVEDDSLLSEMYRRKLESSGFTVLLAEDGVVGEKYALDKHPDLILLDLQLPKKDGMEVLKDLRATAWGQKVPVLILTNVEADDAKLKEILDYHPVFYITKTSTTPEDVLEKIQSVLV